MNPKKVLFGVVGLAVLGGGIFFALSLFRHTTLDEPLPFGASPGADGEVPDRPLVPSVVDQHEMSEAESMMKEDGEGISSEAAVVEGTSGHPASGTARIVSSDGQMILRYENFKTINGPDIFVYLAKDKEAKEFIDLGKVRATEGNVNYEIPGGVDPRDYPYALVWCRAFGVLFNSAKLY